MKLVVVKSAAHTVVTIVVSSSRTYRVVGSRVRKIDPITQAIYARRFLMGAE